MYNDSKAECGAGKSSPDQQLRQLWRTAVKWAERILLILGLALLGLYAAARIEGVLRSRAALQQFEKLAASGAEVLPGAETVEPSAQSEPVDTDFNLWSAQRIEAYQSALAERTNAPLAVLRIAKVSLVVPVFDGTSDLTLNHAVGRIPGTARPGQRGNVGIAGHRDSFFRKLKDVGEGDAIELQTLQGTDTYIVERISIVTPDDVDVLRPRTVPSLTLITCYPFYYLGSAPQRYIVTAFLSEERENGQEKSETPAVISKLEKGERQ